MGDTTGMGENQQYDANGEAVSRRLLQSDDQSDDQGPPQDDQGPTGPQTLGSVIDAILSHISDEQGRVNDECDAQERETVRLAEMMKKMLNKEAKHRTSKVETEA